MTDKIAVVALVLAVLGFVLPTPTEILAGGNVTITESGSSITITANNSGGGGSGASSLSQLTIDTNKDWQNYSITNVSLPSDNTKVNKTGDDMTGLLNISYSASNVAMQLYNPAGGFPSAFRQNNLGSISFITNWNLTSNSRFNSSYPVWIFRMIANQSVNADKFEVVRSPDGVTFTNFFSIDYQGVLTMSNLSGSGNDYVCVDSTGKLYRSDAICS